MESSAGSRNHSNHHPFKTRSFGETKKNHLIDYETSCNDNLFDQSGKKTLLKNATSLDIYFFNDERIDIKINEKNTCLPYCLFSVFVGAVSGKKVPKKVTSE